MGYYDQGYLNYYYWLASEFAVSDRWFSPIASKSVNNRIATFSGGTTQGLVKDPGGDDHLPQLSMETIFQEARRSQGLMEDLLHCQRRLLPSRGRVHRSQQRRVSRHLLLQLLLLV